jgi:hypothetical protein
MSKAMRRGGGIEGLRLGAPGRERHIVAVTGSAVNLSLPPEVLKTAALAAASILGLMTNN